MAKKMFSQEHLTTNVTPQLPPPGSPGYWAAAAAIQKQRNKEFERLHPHPPNVYDLSHCVGLKGLLTKPEDIEKWKAVKAELLRQANQGNYEAIFALGREAEFPSVQGTKPNWNDAAFWYGAGTNRNDHRAEYHLGRMYENNLVPGVRDPIRGRTLMMDAEKKGYLTSTDAMDTADHSGDALLLLAGMAAWVAAVSGSNGGPTTTTSATTHVRSCTKQRRVRNYDGLHESWHTETYLAWGSSCDWN
jgi:hypothetical protein